MDSSNKKHNPSTRKVNSGELAFSVEIDYLVFQGHVRWDKLALGERWPAQRRRWAIARFAILSHPTHATRRRGVGRTDNRQLTTNNRSGGPSLASRSCPTLLAATNRNEGSLHEEEGDHHDDEP